MSEKVPLSFKVLGKVFTYEGIPSKREIQFFDLIAQRGVPESDVGSAYRDNFTAADTTASLEDDAILERYHSRIAERSQKKKRDKSRENNNNASTDILPDVVTPPAPASNKTTPRKEESPRPPAQTAQSLAPPTTDPNRSSLTAEEVDSLNNFISSVLTEKSSPGGLMPSAAVPQRQPQNTPRGDIPTTRQETGASGNFGSGTFGSGTFDAPQGGAVSAKQQIFLQQDGVESQKMISVPRTITYAELQENITRKLNMEATLSFIDSDGMRIDLDDNDALEMFLSMSAKKLTLKCIGTKPIPVAGSITTRAVAAQEAISITTPTVAPARDGTTAAGMMLPAVATQPQEQPLVKSLLGHTAAVYGCAWSPDGSQVVSASRDQTVKIWDVNKGVVSQTIKAHSAFVLCCDFSPKGTHIVSCSDDLTIKLWNKSGKKMYTLKEHTDKVYCAQFMSTGESMATCSCDCTVKVWNVENGQRLSSLKPHEKSIFRIGISQSDGGKHIVTSCDDHTSYILDWKDSKIVRKLVGHTSTVWSAQFSHDDKYILTTSMDHTIKMWDVATGREVCTFNGHATPVHAALFCQRSRDTTAISCARDWTIGLWDVASTKLSMTFTGHTNTVYNIAQRDDMLLSCSLDESLKLWRIPKRILDPV